MSNQIIKTQRENIVADNRWVTLYFDDVLFPNGKTGKYNRLVEKGGNGIVILPYRFFFMGTAPRFWV